MDGVDSAVDEGDVVTTLVGGDVDVTTLVCRELVAGAAHAVLTRDPRECTGNFFIDDDVLTEEGVTDFSVYGGPLEELELDIFLDA